MSNIIGNTFLNLITGPGIIWVVMLEFILLFLLSVWQKGLLSGDSSSRAIDPEEVQDSLNEENNPQFPEQIAFVEIEVEAGE